MSEVRVVRVLRSRALTPYTRSAQTMGAMCGTEEIESSSGHRVGVPSPRVRRVLVRPDPSTIGSRSPLRLCLRSSRRRARSSHTSEPGPPGSRARFEWDSFPARPSLSPGRHRRLCPPGSSAFPRTDRPARSTHQRHRPRWPPPCRVRNHLRPRCPRCARGLLPFHTRRSEPRSPLHPWGLPCFRPVLPVRVRCSDGWPGPA